MSAIKPAIKLLTAAALSAFALSSFPQEAGAPARVPASKDPAAVARVARYAGDWKFKSRRLSREEVDALLAKPGEVLFLDLRRPDEQIQFGSFPVFLSVQNGDLEKELAWLPRDRGLVLVSNHSQRAGAAADLLAAKGYKVVGATGAEEYEVAGGTEVQHLAPPVRRAAAGAASAPKS
jgi:rhodanese-related sulfurtransferase